MLLGCSVFVFFTSYQPDATPRVFGFGEFPHQISGFAASAGSALRPALAHSILRGSLSREERTP